MNNRVPSVVIALDASSERALIPIMKLISQGIEPRQRICDFFRLRFQDKFLLQQAGDAADQEEPTTQNRFALFTSFVEKVPQIENLFNDLILRSEDHERLIQAGYPEANLHFNYFILTDTKSLMGGALLLPVIAVLNKILLKRKDSSLHVLLNVANFTDQNSDEALRIVSLLGEMKAILSDKTSLIKKVYLESFQLDQNDIVNNFALYLFHNVKDGGATIVDNEMMELMIGNALLGLLSGDIAEKSLRRIQEANPVTASLYPSSIGCITVGYEPAALQQKYTRNYLVEVINNLFLAAPKDDIVTAKFALARERVGGYQEWISQVLKGIPDADFDFESKQARTTLKLTELGLPPMIRLTSKSWVEELKTTIGQIQQNFLSSTEELVARGSAMHQALLLEQVNDQANELVSAADCYPGGLKTAIFTLEKLASFISDNQKELRAEAKRVETNIIDAENKLEARLSDLSSLQEKLPALPKIVRKLPQEFQEKIALIYYQLRSGVKVRLLEIGIEEISKAVNDLLSVKLHRRLLNLCAIIQDTLLSDQIGSLPSQIEGINGLVSNLEAYVSSGLQEGDSNNSSIDTMTWNENFRINMVNGPISRVLEARYKISDSDMIQRLLVGYRVFAQWRDSIEKVTDRLYQSVFDLYTPLNELTMQDLQSTSVEIEEDPNPPLDAQKIALYCKTSQALMDPPDVISENMPCRKNRYLSLGDERWNNISIPPEVTDSWERVSSYDSNILNFMQVWENLPFSCLERHFTETINYYKSLPARKKSEFDLAQTTNFVDITDADGIRNFLYQWEFVPEKSSARHMLTLSLKIDMKRYQDYKSRPRILDFSKWDHYAVEDMPELVELVSGFLNIFNQHPEWNAFNRAFCVLKFAQNAIKYRKDSETTPKSDWPRYPVETLAEGIGDCEDVAILCCSILARLGFSVALFLTQNHMAFGVAGAPDLEGDYVVDKDTGQKYYYGEATADGWRLGEMPENMKSAKILEIIKIRLLMDNR